jgi:hypothetical protein
MTHTNDNALRASSATRSAGQPGVRRHPDLPLARHHQPSAQEGPLNRPRRTRLRSFGDGLTQFLLFLLGPADIGPLAPPGATSPVQVAHAKDPPKSTGMPHDAAGAYINVIPVP